MPFPCYAVGAMTLAAQQSPVTAEQLLERPDDDYKYELDRGALVRMSPTGAEHGVVTVKLGHALHEHVEATGAGVCCGAETGFILQRDPDVVRAPDAAFVAAARIPESGVPASYWPFAPDFAAEVASPSDRFAPQRQGGRVLPGWNPSRVDRRTGHARRLRLSRPESSRRPGRGGRIDRSRRITRVSLCRSPALSPTPPGMKSKAIEGLVGLTNPCRVAFAVDQERG